MQDPSLLPHEDRAGAWRIAENCSWGAWPVPKGFKNSEVVKTGRSGSEPEVRIPDPKIRLEFSIY